jgi:hypothetical protein
MSLFSIGFFSACSRSSHDPAREVSQISFASIANADLPPKEKAEELAKAAEQLLSAEGLIQANEFAVLALKEDPENLRAQFVKVLSNLYLTERGIYARIKPLAEKHPEMIAAYNKSIEDLKEAEVKTPGLTKFLFDGQPNIHTEADLQDYFDTTIQAIIDLRQFAIDHHDAEITIKNNGHLFKNLSTRFASACEIKTTAENEYELDCPPNATRFYVTINPADFELIKMGTNWLILTFSIYNAYDLTGTVDVMKNFPSFEREKKAQEVYDALLKSEKVGTLRANSRLKQIKGLGQDIVLTFQWAMANQTSLCPYGRDSKRNRTGTANPEGFCMGAGYQPFIKIISDIFSGTAINRTAARNGESYTAQVNWMGLFDNPISDLRKLGPWKYEGCSVRQVGDPTLGGIFPNGDANKLLALEPGSCTL